MKIQVRLSEQGSRYMKENHKRIVSNSDDNGCMVRAWIIVFVALVVVPALICLSEIF